MMPDIVFIGDSLIEFYDWQGRFPGHWVRNLGIAGETVEWLLERLPRVLGDEDKPDMVFLMSGINNVAMEDTGFIEAYENAVKTIHRITPGTALYVQSLLPTLLPWVSGETITELNKAIEAVAGRIDGTGYMDVHSLFVSDGVERCLLEDGVHISERGYEVWSGAVERTIMGSAGQAK